VIDTRTTHRISAILTVTTAIALLAAAPAAAQVPGLGVKAGLNLASQNTGDAGEDPGLQSLRAIVAGVFATLPVTSWLEVQPEALYSVKGSSFEDGGIKAKVLVDYLEVPVLARFSMGGGRLAYYAAGGPFVAVRLRARTRTTFDSATEEIDVSDEVQRVDYGLAAGGGVEFGSLVVDGRYTHGLKDVDKDTSDRVKVTNRSISITLGFRF
jgi:hypothetical protein